MGETCLNKEKFNGGIMFRNYRNESQVPYMFTGSDNLSHQGYVIKSSLSESSWKFTTRRKWVETNNTGL